MLQFDEQKEAMPSTREAANHETDGPNPSGADPRIKIISEEFGLATLVDSMVAASQREAEAHQAAAMLAKENNQLWKKLKVLIGDKISQSLEGTAEVFNRKIILFGDKAPDAPDVPAVELVEHAPHQSPDGKRRKVSQFEEREEDGRRCRCRNSKCLKLYCECFAAGILCDDLCSCHGCLNKPEHEDTIVEARERIQVRTPHAFSTKFVKLPEPVSESEEEGSALSSHKIGCKCRKSMCNKKYCECFQAGVGCSTICHCIGCKNAFGKKKDLNTMESKMSPPGYVCHMCKVPEHFVQHCPTVDGPDCDLQMVEPPSGTLKSAVVATADGSSTFPNGTIPVLEPNDAALEKGIKALHSIWSVSDFLVEFQCPLCKEVLKDAVLTSKCCCENFCEKCIKEYIIMQSRCVCGATVAVGDSLIPNKKIRKMIKCVSATRTSSAVNAGNTLPVQDMESACCHQLEGPPNSNSATMGMEHRDVSILGAAAGRENVSPPALAATMRRDHGAPLSLAAAVKGELA